MKHSVEFEGKNVDNAIDNACIKLNMPKENLKYDVISSGSSGIFGLVGVKKAKIRVNLSDTEHEKYNRYAKPNKIKALVDEAFNVNSQSIAEDDLEKDNIETETETETGHGPESEPKVIFSEELIQTGKEALQKIVDLITTDAVISVSTKSDKILFDIEGGNSAVLIGKKGQTLESIQYIVDKIVNKNSGERVLVQIDIEGYLEARKESLINLAERLAERTRRTGRPSTISQMTAHDRRIVHLALKNNRSVRTQSVGDGHYRRLIIFPKKNFRRKKTYSNSYRNS